MQNLTQDMTKKNPLGLILKFAIPLLIGNIFQQAYTIVDSIIVGRGVGSFALASIGAVDWLQWMLSASLIGLAQGFGVAFSRSFGEKDYKELKNNIYIGFILSVIIGVLFVVFSEIFSYKLLILLNTPTEIIYLSLEYIRFLFLGLIIVMMYNFLASILRAIGNSKTPLIAMIFAAIINICLDIYFIFELKMGVKGAAIATVIAQFFSAIYCFTVLKKIEILDFTKEDYKFNINKAIYLLKLGLPMSFMNIIIGIGGIIVQRVTNIFGIVFVTGVTITNKLYALFEIGGTSIGLSVATYTAQNHGAKNIDRIFKGFKAAVALAIISSFIIGGLMIVFGKNIISLFIDVNLDNSKKIIDVSYAYLSVMCFGLWLLHLLHIFRSTLQGLGNTLFPLYSSIIEFILRVTTVLIASKIIGGNAIFYSEISAWTGAVLFLGTGVYLSFNDLEKFCEII